MDETYDVVVIGGGAAGLTGAVALARSRRSVLVVDSGEPRNASAGHVHNFLTRDGTPPADIYALGRAEVTAYGGRIETGRVAAVRRDGDGFRIDRDGRPPFGARRVLVATGLRDELPDIPGLSERWGIDVLHCPYCHGWEVRDQRVGILSTGPMTGHSALLFRQLTAHVTVLTHTGPPLDDGQREQLAARMVQFVDGAVAAVESADGRLTGVRLEDGRLVELDALVVVPRMRARADFLAPLGLAPVDVTAGEHVFGHRIEADPTGATTAPGVWVAGNVTDLHVGVVNAAAAGMTAASMINADLAAEDARTAVDYERTYGEPAWEERYRSSARIWSGEPNSVLVDEVSDLVVGRALDVGCGEGADALWLAERGWKVTAVDVSSTALTRAAEQADQRGLTVDWRHVDLIGEPLGGRFDLVTVFYVHLPEPQRETMLARVADAVAPGGVLLIVGHDPSDLGTGVARPDLAVLRWNGDEVRDQLGAGWTVRQAEIRPRRHHPHSGQPAESGRHAHSSGHDGEEVIVHDTVIRARREG